MKAMTKLQQKKTMRLHELAKEASGDKLLRKTLPTARDRERFEYGYICGWLDAENWERALRKDKP